MSSPSLSNSSDVVDPLVSNDSENPRFLPKHHLQPIKQAPKGPTNPTCFDTDKERSTEDVGENSVRVSRLAVFLKLWESHRAHSISLAIHIALVLFLFFTFFKRYQAPLIQIEATTESGNVLKEPESVDIEIPTEDSRDSIAEVSENDLEQSVNRVISQNISTTIDSGLMETSIDFEEGDLGLPGDHLNPAGGSINESVEEMSKAQRSRKFGGTLGSERAVQNALRWLAAHQYPDGSWRLKHSLCPNCLGKCQNDGVPMAPTAATGFGLLPFLAAGHTHQTQGPYREVVKKGLHFLTSQVKKNRYGGDLRSAVTGSKDSGGSMYAHGVATLALTEAYSLTRDSRLKPYVIATIRFIENTQGTAGGWSYFGEPKKPFTTISLTGWQMVALYSAEKAGIRTKPRTWKGIVHYLKLNRAYANGKNDGRYGYSHTKVDLGKTAAQPIGLLAELYLNKGSLPGEFHVRVKELINDGPKPAMAYYNYYAHQLVFHYTGGHGDDWKKWNQKMLDVVVPKQNQDGHQRGSWFQKGAPAYLSSGGRMMDTSLNTLILAVYFRHLPMYTGGSIESEEIEEFELE